MLLGKMQNMLHRTAMEGKVDCFGDWPVNGRSLPAQTATNRSSLYMLATCERNTSAGRSGYPTRATRFSRVKVFPIQLRMKTDQFDVFHSRLPPSVLSRRPSRATITPAQESWYGVYPHQERGSKRPGGVRHNVERASAQRNRTGRHPRHARSLSCGPTPASPRDESVGGASSCSFPTEPEATSSIG